MKIVIESPVKAFIVESTISEVQTLRDKLTYTHLGNQHLLKRHYDNFYFRSKNPIKWEEQLEELKKKQKFTLIFEEDGRKFVRPGSLPYLKDSINLEIENKVFYPVSQKMEWKNPLPFKLYPYQKESCEKLIAEKHGNVSLTTGSGKTALALQLCKDLGLKTAVITPSKAIYLDMLDSFEHHFGKDKVGTFGNGSKKIGKQFTVCICDSIVNIKPDTKEAKFFNDLDVLIIDESHVMGSETLEDICHNILANIPYRFFLSATQIRGDGGLKLLQSVIGKTVYTLTTAEAVRKGYINPHEFIVVDLESSNPNIMPKDPLDIKRIHFLRNKNIAAFIAKFCNTVCPITGEQVLVLVEELDQITTLIEQLKVPYVYAHAETKQDRLDELGLKKVKTKESIDQFNRNDNASVLISTSVCHVGVNIFSTHHTFNWIGGTSEVKTKQAAIGRSIRKMSSNPYANKCKPKPVAKIYDFLIRDVDLMKKHLSERLEYYKESESSIKIVKIK